MDTKWRQSLHLEPPHGWLNDPNGLCWFNGKYHVYFQYSPDSPLGNGRKGWGHYESSDLLTWKFNGMVLEPDCPQDRDGVYSGSAIEARGMLHLFYTGNVKEDGDYDYIYQGREANVITVSTADGHHMGAKNILLRNEDYPAECSCHVRDPKVWREDGLWHMVLGARTRNDRGCALLYESRDLCHWNYRRSITLPDFGYMWECPDIFEISGTHYLSVSPQGLPHGEYSHQNVYSSGYFNINASSGNLESHGKEEPLTDFQEWDYGFDFYAPQTFPAPDGRRILYGWMGLPDIPYGNPTTLLGWQHCLTLPRVVTADEDGALMQNPVEELEKLRYDSIKIEAEKSVTVALPFDLVAKLDTCANTRPTVGLATASSPDHDAPTASAFWITIQDCLTLTYEDGIFLLSFHKGACGAGRTQRKVKLEQCRNIRILADNSSLEIYLDGGRKVMSTRFYPTSEQVTLTTSLPEAVLYKMKSLTVIDGTD